MFFRHLCFASALSAKGIIGVWSLEAGRFDSGLFEDKCFTASEAFGVTLMFRSFLHSEDVDDVRSRSIPSDCLGNDKRRRLSHYQHYGRRDRYLERLFVIRSSQTLTLASGHRVASILRDECNPHHSIYRAMQDTPVDPNTDFASVRSLNLNTCNRSAINCLTSFIVEGPPTPASSAAAASTPAPTKEVVKHRLLSGDNCGLLVLWVCEPQDSNGLSLRPLLSVSLGRVLNGTPLSFFHRVIPPWVSSQVEFLFTHVRDLTECMKVKGIDPTPIRERFVADSDHSRPESRLLDLRSPIPAIRSLDYRDGYVLIGTYSNGVYEMRLDGMREALMTQNWIRACQPRW